MRTPLPGLRHPRVVARIADSKGRPEGSGFARVFGDPQVGHLISRVQATSIRGGTELETMLLERVQTIEDLDVFLLDQTMKEGVQVASKKVVKKSKMLETPGKEPDLLVFKRRHGKQTCHVIELKDGDAFDTKKASGEYAAMQTFLAHVGPRLPYTLLPHFVCFNQDDRQAIFTGFKRAVPLDQCMTGRELCELLEIDYDEILSARKADQPANLDYFVKALLNIPAIRQRIAAWWAKRSE